MNLMEKILNVYKNRKDYNILKISIVENTDRIIFLANNDLIQFEDFSRDSSINFAEKDTPS